MAASSRRKAEAVSASSSPVVHRAASGREAAAARATRSTRTADGALEAYLAKLRGWQREAVVRITARVLAVGPGVACSIKWAQPVFELEGPLAYVRPAARHVTLGFWRGVELQCPQGLLEGAGERMRHVKVASLEALAAFELEELVRQAVRLNRAHGDPTRRDPERAPPRRR